ncbi:MAG: protein phosphatase 2C domain-containing protein [bacterium]
MLNQVQFVYDAAVVAAIGRRELQEDAIASRFPAKSELAYVVLADGMGGHSDGDLASQIVVQEFLDEMELHADDPANLERNISLVLRHSIDRANRAVASEISTNPDRTGMGTTFVAPVFLRNRLYWVSVGDSPLYLMRGNRLSRLNQEHSFAKRLDRLVSDGLISKRDADLDPDRQCLTSALSGGFVAEIDLPDRPLELLDGDVVIVASDGLLFIDESQVARLVFENRDRPSTEISARLIREIQENDDPQQDNVSLCVIKVSQPAPAEKLQPPAPIRPRKITPKRTTVQLQVQRKDNRVIRKFSLQSED